MFKWMVFAPARPVACAFALALMAALAVIGTVRIRSPRKRRPRRKAKKKAAPKAAAEAAAGPAAGRSRSAATDLLALDEVLPEGAGGERQAGLFHRQGRPRRIGQPVVAAVLIEPDGEPRKILRVTLPLGMSLQPGTRVIIDQGQPMTGPYVICFNNGCMADYEASDELIGNMKKGQGLVVQGINGAGQAISLVLPLNDFAKAYDGPPTDPKVFEEQQKKLQEELQRRAEEARKKLEGQPK